MNERIRELATEVGISVEYLTNTKQIVLIEKFAELIVKECIEVIDNTSDNTKLMRVDPYQKIIWAIEEHFGVEQ
jgi:hypothetical protein